MKIVKNTDKIIQGDKSQITDKQAEEAFRTIIKWIGEDPTREGLASTPRRVVKAFKEYFKGYNQDHKSELGKTFGDIKGYDDMALQKNISISSHCEHILNGVKHLCEQDNYRALASKHINRATCEISKRTWVKLQDGVVHFGWHPEESGLLNFVRYNLMSQLNQK